MKRNKQAAKQDNYLDYIPAYSEFCEYETDEAGHVTILQYNKGLFNKAAQLIFRKPKISYIHLDEMGNFIWPLMDGVNSVYDIAKKVHEEYGEEAEPLYERLIRYLQVLESYGFVVYRNRT